jgi:hypothetical protein
MKLRDREAGSACIDQVIYDLDPNISTNVSIQMVEERTRTVFSRIQQDMRLPPMISPDFDE